jgi:hypothetical protein
MRKSFFYILVLLFVSLTFGCMGGLEKSSKPKMPDNFQKVTLKAIKTELYIPKTWKILEKDSPERHIYFFISEKNTTPVDAIYKEGLMNTGEDYSAGASITAGSDNYFNQQDIKMMRNVMPNTIEEENSQQGDISVSKFLISDGYNYLQVMLLTNKRKTRFLRYEFRSSKDMWEKNKNISDVIMNSIKTNLDF